MNWIEIDKILYGIIARHNNIDDMLAEAKKQFKWTDSQAEAAVKPLLSRNTIVTNLPQKPKSTPKRSTKGKKKL